MTCLSFAGLIQLEAKFLSSVKSISNRKIREFASTQGLKAGGKPESISSQGVFLFCDSLWNK